ncbi:dnaJ homolog subfamily C member 28-like [Anneissia japonica]|uniref:dnaJ homolog subfamily C member 28-like n=1 Tax=Anneissia japonica TaxID=1529436 RepID=UPI001425A5D2|nr:dnaJ homolog subfamily C member 28-like [Anneissia japonica]
MFKFLEIRYFHRLLDVKTCKWFHIGIVFQCTHLQDVKRCYELLKLEDDCKLCDAKAAYIKLAKRYHPDSSSCSANIEKFRKIHEAYDKVCAHIQKEERKEELNKEEELEFTHMYTAMQHRQYLNYEGVGIGTPSQRQQQYHQYRAVRAMDSVSERRIGKIVLTHEDAMVIKDKKAAKKIKSTNVIHRLVEDLYQESYKNGEFDNLPGKGKPLPTRSDYNPYVDISTHNMNRVLISNGYAPDWVTKRKDIFFMIEDNRKKLLKERQKLGKAPLSPYNEDKWRQICLKFDDNIMRVNKIVDSLNLAVPIINLQLVQFSSKKELAKVMDQYAEIEALEKEVAASRELEKTIEDEKFNLKRIFQQLIEKLYKTV